MPVEKHTKKPKEEIPEFPLTNPDNISKFKASADITNGTANT